MARRRFGLQEAKVHFGTFDYTLVCVVGPSNGAERYVRWQHDDPDFTHDFDSNRGLIFFRKGYAPIIWLRRKPRTAREIGTLAHEVMHAVGDMLVRWAGMSLNNDTDEAFCHALGFGVTEILRQLK